MLAEWRVGSLRSPALRTEAVTAYQPCKASMPMACFTDDKTESHRAEDLVRGLGQGLGLSDSHSLRVRGSVAVVRKAVGKVGQQG